jgi:hypothetical protein
MDVVESKIPKIVLNGEPLDELIKRHCRKLTITKEVGNCDVINIELAGMIDLVETVSTPFIYINLKGKKYQLVEVIEDVI